MHADSDVNENWVKGAYWEADLRYQPIDANAVVFLLSIYLRASA